MRAREFIMKDAYSFHADKSCLDKSYNSYKKAYENIFKRLGLNYTVVSADSGNIGGDESHEYHVIADTGEDDLLISDISSSKLFAIAYRMLVPPTSTRSALLIFRFII